MRNADNQVDEDCDGQVDEAPGAVAECSPRTQLSRVCIPDLFPSFYGFQCSMESIVFTRANSLMRTCTFQAEA